MTISHEQALVERLIAEISREYGHSPAAGASWVTFSNGEEGCYRGLDAAGCAELQARARLKTTFYAQRFCP